MKKYKFINNFCYFVVGTIIILILLYIAMFITEIIWDYFKFSGLTFSEDINRTDYFPVTILILYIEYFFGIRHIHEKIMNYLEKKKYFRLE